MAHVAVHNHSEPIQTSSSSPFIDRLTHSVIKETSKTIKHYIDVKRRENGFVLNPNSSAVATVPLKARCLYGTAREYPPSCRSCYSDIDVKHILRSVRQHQRHPFSSANSLEKQICREELDFHMGPQKFSPRASQEFAKLQLHPPRRSSSACSSFKSRSHRQDVSKSNNYERDQLTNNAADILGALVKARRTIINANILSQQTQPSYLSRNVNPSPRQTDDQSVDQPGSRPPSVNDGTFESDQRLADSTQKKKKRTTNNDLAKSLSIMQKAKLITNNIYCDYKITVTTGDCNGASTNAPIRIKLYGTKGYTEFSELTESETYRVPFSRGHTDIFNIRTYHVGQLAGITIGHDQQDTQSGWFLSTVTINDSLRDQTYEIQCNAWLSSKSADQKTIRDFPVASLPPSRRHSTTNRGRDDVESQSESSITLSSRTSSSRHISASGNKHLTEKKGTKAVPDRRSQSRGSITVLEKPTKKTSPSSDRSDESITLNTNKNRSKRIPSPAISITPRLSPDVDIPENFAPNDGITSPLRRPSSPSPPPPVSERRKPTATRRSSITQEAPDDILRSEPTEYERPPGRLDNRSPSIASITEQKKKENYDDDFDNDDDDDADSFFK